jgi:hypothetical protein
MTMNKLLVLSVLTVLFAGKLEVNGQNRLFLIWEQDKTYQDYIRPNWEQFNIPTIISDQFDRIAYIWPTVLPNDVKPYFEANWMTKLIINGHGPLCDVYENNRGAFNAEGDTPSFLHCIPNGLRSMESPGNGGITVKQELISKPLLQNQKQQKRQLQSRKTHYLVRRFT